MSRRASVLANDPVAEQAARELCLSGGSAVACVLAGFFAAAGAHAGVLLSPLSLLAGGLGHGARALDGRLRQPGLSTKRPRGFTPGEPIPDAARVAVPMGVSALLVAHAYDRGQGLASVLRAGIARAERGGAPARAGLLQRIRSVGAGAFSEVSFTRALLRVAGPGEGGLLTPSDFAQVPELDFPAVDRPGLGGTLTVTPWADQVDSVPERGALDIGCAVCAIDARGVLAVLWYLRVQGGLPIDELELEAPLMAVPVRRGVTRVVPGSPLPAPAPIALHRSLAESLPNEVVAAPGALRLDDEVPVERRLWLRRDPHTLAVETIRRAS